jgi:hypothetical protein
MIRLSCDYARVSLQSVIFQNLIHIFFMYYLIFII